MANARLHVICGNCGSNDDFELKIERNFNDIDGVNFEDETMITCKNCSTIHFLTSVAEYQGWDVKNGKR
jgi:RNase P subunit RPR2